jgi:DNA repair exonuclease SbcCD ATPase subunit
MRLKQIEISGFRGIAAKQSFDLSADAIVIVGSNGLGKTSLLDAIHWGMSGRLGRISGGDVKLVSMYSPTGQARVALTLVHGDEDFTITRTFDGELQSVGARIEGVEFKGTSARARILESLWPEAASAKDGDESLSSALARSVYLQQDRLRDFLENATDQDRFNVISELVGAGRLTELQAQLESESRSWSRATTQKEKELAPLAERVENLKAQLDKLRESASGGSELRESQWNEWWDSCKKLGLSLATIPSPTASDAGILLDKSLRDIRALRDSNRRKRSLIELTIDLVKSAPPKAESTIDKLQERLSASGRAAEEARAAMKTGQERAAAIRQERIAVCELREQQRALAHLAIRHLNDRCPVCGQSYDVNQTRARLQGIIDSGDSAEPTPEGGQSIEALASKEKEAVENEGKARNALTDAKRLQKQYEQWEKDCNDKLAELGIQEKEDMSAHLGALHQECESLEERFKVHTADGEALSLNIARESASARIKSTEADLRTAESELAKHRLALAKREKTSTMTRLLIEQLREARSKIAVAKLTEIEPLLQRIFARIDPHPTFRVVKFATDVIRGKGRLDAEIHDSREEMSSKAPEAIFSSSQLNALAVSVFLAFNLALPHLPLQSAILDDPIQSLDEINLLGLVDLLRRIKDKRQIIVSTHDARFGQLLARKLRPSSGDEATSIIELRSWKRSGPDVLQYAVEADSAPLRLAAVS